MNSHDYWLQREQENLKIYITEEAEYQKEIDRIYQEMLDACQKDIESFYAKYASAEGISLAEAKKRVSQHDVKAFERTAARYVKEKNFSAKANEELRLYNATMRINRLEMLKANIGLETIAGHNELEKFMAGILKGRTEDELKRQAGILGKTIKNNAAKANAIVNGSFRVDKVGNQSTFSDRIWQYQDIMRQDLGKLLQQGLIQGKGARALASDLRKYLVGDKTGKGATYNIERLMRTELARVQTEAQKQSFVRNGFEYYEFICNHNGNTCSICSSLNGKHFKVADMMPGDNAPPVHPNCRCSTAAWEDNQEYEEWLDYLDRGGSTESWNNLQNRVEIINKNPSKALEKSANGSIIKLDNKNVREWYVNAVSMIKDNIPSSLPLEDRSRQAFDARNRIRTTAREMMDDEARRLKLYNDKKNKAFEELIESKMNRKGLTYEEALQDIFDTATKTNADVNKEFGID